ncbi:segregation and condensation protein A [Williamsoniiplasma somnilux]|uniref:Segregation and condensation protein A n=1 Tax=Williamsoniiplasma somnilux TaxID=215578 RepID=A0A2K8P1S3_9MOLU|nr:segregation/condensation protein A [Williamsoniiplasma somnilux]ATZ18853.1 segregation and condensation protein A [Williamsoniiplasma somnilux]
MKHWEEVNIGHFSGPLDLLVTMIKEKKISIMDVNLIELADQYLEYINSQKALDIEIASEYLAMAAQLIELKSHLLLPREQEEFYEEDYSYENFLEQLTRYDQIKSVTDFFASKQEEYLKSFSKNKTKTKFSAKIQKNNETEDLFDPLSMDMEDFAQIFKRLMMQAEIRDFDPNFVLEEESYNTITTEILSPQDISNMILNKMQSNKFKEWRLEELVSKEIMNLRNLISTFLAVLDLVRHSVAKIEQKDNTLLIQFSKEVLEDEKIIKALEVQINE